MNLTTKILLTIYLGGRLASSTASKLDKSEKSKVVTSPFEKAVFTQGKFSGYVTPKGLYLAKNAHKAPVYGECKQILKISEYAYEHFINSDEIPDYFILRKKAIIWRRMSKADRLKFHLDRIAGGNQYTTEFI